MLRLTQISGIGDVLYTVYYSYIYIVSVLLLLGMVAAIILTADIRQNNNIIKEENIYDSTLYKKSSFCIITYSLYFFLEKFNVKRVTDLYFK